MQTTNLQLIQPSLNLEICVDADSCGRELKRCADEADRCAALAQAGAELAIRHAWNAGAICNKAKEVIPHGEFQAWLEANAGERGYVTMLKWMKMAKVQLVELLENSPKGMMDAYRATGGDVAGVLAASEAGREMANLDRVLSPAAETVAA
jgi:hypothetical protein